jgi:hypothetical protein
MKILSLLIAVFTLLAASVPAPVLAAGWVDTDIANCSWLGKHTDCEWVATVAGKSIAPVGSGHDACPSGTVWTREGGYWHCVC